MSGAGSQSEWAFSRHIRYNHNPQRLYRTGCFREALHSVVRSPQSLPLLGSVICHLPVISQASWFKDLKGKKKNSSNRQREKGTWLAYIREMFSGSWTVGSACFPGASLQCPIRPRLNWMQFSQENLPMLLPFKIPQVLFMLPLPHCLILLVNTYRDSWFLKMPSNEPLWLSSLTPRP